MLIEEHVEHAGTGKQHDVDSSGHAITDGRKKMGGLPLLFWPVPLG